MNGENIPAEEEGNLEEEEEEEWATRRGGESLAQLSAGPSFLLPTHTEQEQRRRPHNFPCDNQKSGAPHHYTLRREQQQPKREKARHCAPTRGTEEDQSESRKNTVARRRRPVCRSIHGMDRQASRQASDLRSLPSPSFPSYSPRPSLPYYSTTTTGTLPTVRTTGLQLEPVEALFRAFCACCYATDLLTTISVLPQGAFLFAHDSSTKLLRDFKYGSGEYHDERQRETFLDL